MDLEAIVESVGKNQENKESKNLAASPKKDTKKALEIPSDRKGSKDGINQNNANGEKTFASPKKEKLGNSPFKEKQCLSPTKEKLIISPKKETQKTEPTNEIQQKKKESKNTKKERKKKEKKEKVEKKPEKKEKQKEENIKTKPKKEKPKKEDSTNPVINLRKSRTTNDEEFKKYKNLLNQKVSRPKTKKQNPEQAQNI